MKEENLILIISQPRAGSTYLQNLLSNNSQANTCSEPWLLLNFANQIRPKLVEAKFDNKIAVKAFEDYIQKYNLKFETKQKQFLLELYNPLNEGFEFVIDKTPRYWEIIDEIKALFPKSKIIILKRNPIDVAKSIMKTWRLKDLDELSDYKRDLLVAPNKIQCFCEEEKENPQVYVLRYEDLIEKTEFYIKEIYKWIGLKYSTSVLEISKNNKYKGLYGDPFQNSEDYSTEKKKVDLSKLSSAFKSFLVGYYSYLGSDFLKSYGGYQNKSINSKSTLAFKYYNHFANSQKQRSFFREVYWQIKKAFLQLLIR